MKKFLIIAMLLCCSLTLLARPAYPGIRTVKQPDGTTLQVMAHGDEWGHWYSDAQGRVLMRGKDGFFRVATGVTPKMAAKAASIRRQARVQVRSQAAKASGHVAVGQKHFLVILVEFADLSFSTPDINTEVYNMLNQKGYSKNGATGSAQDFYSDSSNGYFTPIFDVYGPVTLEGNKADYGGNDDEGNDVNAEQAVVDGCKGLDSQIDFSQYDNDADGTVDMVFMFYAGYGEADSDDEDSIWPHMFYLSAISKSLKLDNKTIDKYACANELAGFGDLEGKLDGIGAVCHEFGHAMGLPDFYDTDGDTYGGKAGGLYDFSTMDAGNYNNYSRTPPYFNMEERILLGWSSESDYNTFSTNGNVTIPAYRPENGTPVAYRTPTDKDGEFFVYECRGSQGWDAGLTGNGLVVYHVDKSNRSITLWKDSEYEETVKASVLWSNWEYYNAVNENGSHPCFYTVVAADQSNLNYAPSYYSGYGNYYGDDGDKVVFPGAKKVSAYNPVSWNAVASDYSFSNIAYSGNQVTLTVTNAATATNLDYPYISNPGKGSYSAGSSFALELVLPDGATATGTSWKLDGSAVSGASVNLSAGSHTLEATVSLNDGKTYVVTLEVTAK